MGNTTLTGLRRPGDPRQPRRAAAVRAAGQGPRRAAPDPHPPLPQVRSPPPRDPAEDVPSTPNPAAPRVRAPHPHPQARTGRAAGRGDPQARRVASAGLFTRPSAPRGLSPRPPVGGGRRPGGPRGARSRARAGGPDASLLHMESGQAGRRARGIGAALRPSGPRGAGQERRKPRAGRRQTPEEEEGQCRLLGRGCRASGSSSSSSPREPGDPDAALSGHTALACAAAEGSPAATTHGPVTSGVARPTSRPACSGARSPPPARGAAAGPRERARACARPLPPRAPRGREARPGARRPLPAAFPPERARARAAGRPRLRGCRALRLRSGSRKAPRVGGRRRWGPRAAPRGLAGRLPAKSPRLLIFGYRIRVFS